MFITKIRIVRYVLPNGKRVRKGTAGATKRIDYSRKFYAVFSKAGRRVKVPLAAEKTEARRMMRELKRHLWRLNLGIVDHFAEHKKKSIAQHVADYLADVRGRGRSVKHVAEAKRLLDTIFQRQSVRTLDDLTLAKFDGFLTDLAQHGRSPRTRNAYRQAAVAFANWLAKKGRLPNNPLLNVSRAVGKGVRFRRALTLAELTSLVRTAEHRNPARALLYRLAVGTGLRRNELKSLRVRHLRLDDSLPTLHLPGEHTKNGKDAVIPIVPWLVQALQVVVQSKEPNDAVVRIPHDILRRFKGDLNAAGIAFADADGRRADFHSLRKCCATLLTIQGVHPRVVQQILRHSTLDLTMTTYTDGSLLPLGEAVAKLPPL
ncbi:MAG: site-specific integrase [Pirellulales bacterium]|nr:site-specific integrase [Pirellulales bacterium]